MACELALSISAGKQRALQHALQVKQEDARFCENTPLEDKSVGDADDTHHLMLKNYVDVPRLGDTEWDKECGQEPEAECPPLGMSPQPDRRFTVKAMAARPEQLGGPNVNMIKTTAVPPTPPIRRPPKAAMQDVAPSLSLPSLGSGAISMPRRRDAPSRDMGLPSESLPAQAKDVHDNIPHAYSRELGLPSECLPSRAKDVHDNELGAHSRDMGPPFESLPARAKDVHDNDAPGIDVVASASNCNFTEPQSSACGNQAVVPQRPEPKNMEDAAAILQACLRGCLERRQLEKKATAAMTLQRNFRHYRARQHEKAAARLQSAFRTALARCSFLRLVSAAGKIQKAIRHWQGEKKRRKSACFIQRAWQQALEKRRQEKLEELHIAKTAAQQYTYDLVALLRSHQRRAAIKVQRAWGKVVCRRILCAIKLQSAVRGAMLRRRIKSEGCILAVGTRASTHGDVKCEVRRVEQHWLFIARSEGILCNALNVTSDDALVIVRQNCNADDQPAQSHITQDRPLFSEVAQILLKTIIIDVGSGGLTLHLPKAIANTSQEATLVPSDLAVQKASETGVKEHRASQKDLVSGSTADAPAQLPNTPASESVEKLRNEAPCAASEELIQATDETILPWQCPSCGFMNEVSPTVCVLCDAERKTDAVTKRPVRQAPVQRRAGRGAPACVAPAIRQPVKVSNKPGLGCF
jgi:hypothetical protein